MKYDVGSITNYMMEYDSGVPISVIIGIFLFVCAIIIVLYNYSTNGIKFLKNTFWAFFGGYFFFVFCTTILFRDKKEEIHYVLYPLWSYSVLDNKLLAEVILNVLLFMPIGFFSGIVFNNANIIKVVGFGCLLSLSIEIFQLLTMRGVCNIDDVIHNTTGCALGYVVYRLCSNLFKTEKWHTYGS